MWRFHTSRSHLLFFAALWSFSLQTLLAAWPEIGHSKPKEQLDPNVRDWGDYSDLPPGMKHGLGLEEDPDHRDNRRVEETSSFGSELDFLAEFAGRSN